MNRNGVPGKMINHGSRQRSSNLSAHTKSSKSQNRVHTHVPTPIQEDEYGSMMTKLTGSNDVRKYKSKTKKTHFEDENIGKSCLSIARFILFLIAF